MYLFLFAFALLLLWLIMFNGRQSAPVQRSRQSAKRIAPDVNSDPFLMSTVSFPITHTPLDPFAEAAPQNVPVENHGTGSVVDTVSFIDYSSSGISAGGELGTALADSIDAGQSSFSAFDSGGNFDGGTPSDGN